MSINVRTRDVHYVLVTGADQGLGKVIAARIEARGASVLRLPAEILHEGKNELEHWLTQNKAWKVDAIVNNYGINHLSKIGTTEEDDAEIFHINVLIPYWIVNWMIARDSMATTVVNIASQTYRVPQRMTALYCASKAALVQMTRVMARELAEYGWVVNALAPGKILGTRMTELTDEQVLQLREWDPEEAESYALKLIPAGRFTTCDEVAAMVEQMIFDLPDYVNGTVIDMMGGV